MAFQHFKTRTLLVCLALLTFGAVPLHAQQQRYHGQTIEEILALPDDKIDLGIACLVMAKDAYPELDINAFDKALDYMAARVKSLIKGKTDPIQRIGMMNTYLYRPGWWNDKITFAYDREDLLATKKESWFLNGCLATKKGSCATMPMLYLVLADRLGWPIKAVLAPQHYFCRYMGIEDGNIEATSTGGFSPDSAYIKDLKIPELAIKNGVYMRPLSKKEYLAALLENNARYFCKYKDDYPTAIRYLELSIKYNPTYSASHWNLANYCDRYAQQIQSRLQGGGSGGSFLPPGYQASAALQEAEAMSRNREFQEAQSQVKRLLELSYEHRKTAKELGIVVESPEEFLKSQVESIEKSGSQQTSKKK